MDDTPQKYMERHTAALNFSLISAYTDTHRPIRFCIKSLADENDFVRGGPLQRFGNVFGSGIRENEKNRSGIRESNPPEGAS